MKYLLLPTIYLLTTITYGQRQITGRILDSETKKPVKEARISITNDSVTTVSNSLGFFQLSVDSTDQIIIQCNGYEEGLVRVPSKGGLQILLEPSNIPEYEGGLIEFYEYCGQNIIYPHKARNKNLQGTVLISFEIDTNGKMVNFRVIQDIGENCGEEIVKIVNRIPGNWTPINRPFTFIFPIRLKLENFNPFTIQSNPPMDRQTYESEVKNINGKLLEEIVITAQPKK